MRWLVVAASLAFSALSIHAAEPLVADDQTVEVAGSVALIDPAVIVTPIPMPALVVELPSGANSAPKLRPVKKVKVEKKKTLHPTMLSRTERHQMALLAARPKTGELSFGDTADGDGDDVPSVADLTLHRFFHRPKVATREGDETDDGADIPETVKLRLFLARMKAVEAHATRAALQDEQPADDLSEAVKLRLFVARARAVAAHEKKFS
mgnify:FL=1